MAAAPSVRKAPLQENYAGLIPAKVPLIVAKVPPRAAGRENAEFNTELTQI